MSRMVRPWLLLASLTLGCGGPTTPSDHLGLLFEERDAEAARELAPDLFSKANRARQQARRAYAAGDEAAAADHSTRARLLLSAAIAEVERIRLEERRLETQSAARRKTEAAMRDERARKNIQKRLQRTVTARLASEQASRAFEAAREVEERRARALGAQAERTHREAARALVQRARLLLAAARAMGASKERVESVAAPLDDLRPTSQPAQAIAAADEAVRRARALVGELRAQASGPNADERAALIEAARQAGLEPALQERGLVLDATDLLPPGSRSAQSRITRIASLLQAHPHGPIRLEVGARGSRAVALRRAEARGRPLQRALVGAGVERERIAVEPVPDARGRVELILVAYGHPTAGGSEPQPAPVADRD